MSRPLLKAAFLGALLAAGAARAHMMEAGHGAVRLVGDATVRETLVQALLRRPPGPLRLSVSATTRKPVRVARSSR